jgi:hypothetical protein
LSIVADKISPPASLIVQFDIKRLFADRSDVLAGSSLTGTQLFGTPATGSRIHSAGIRIFGAFGGTCLTSSVATPRDASTPVSRRSKSIEPSPINTLVPSAHELTGNAFME